MSRAFHLYMVKYPVKRGSKVHNLAFTRGGWPTRRGATAAFVKSLKNKLTWKQCYARGCRVVPVTVSEIRPRNKESIR